jgi:hypothetical protein
MYVRSSGYPLGNTCTLLSVVWMYDGGPSDVHSTNSTQDVRGTTRRTLVFGIPFG